MGAAQTIVLQRLFARSKHETTLMQINRIYDVRLDPPFGLYKLMSSPRPKVVGMNTGFYEGSPVCGSRGWAEKRRTLRKFRFLNHTYMLPVKMNRGVRGANLVPTSPPIQSVYLVWFRNHQETEMFLSISLRDDFLVESELIYEIV
jgi:hypothetical protein